MQETRVPSLGREIHKKGMATHCVENSMDGGAWQTTVHGGCKELEMTGWLSMHMHTGKSFTIWIIYFSLCVIEVF